MRCDPESLLPDWLVGVEAILLAEGDDDDDDDSTDDSEDDQDDSGDQSDDADDESDDDDEEDEDDKTKKVKKVKRGDDETVRLKAALKKERLSRRKFEREARQLRKAVPAKKSVAKKQAKDEEAEAETRAEIEQARQRSERLAGKLARQAVDNVILKMAGGFKFKDPDDAIALVNRADIDVDQDDEDPSDVEVDEDTVKDALRRLAKRKPHLLVQESDEDEEEDDEGRSTKRRRSTGSKFSGKKGRKDELSEEELRKRYSALGPARS